MKSQQRRRRRNPKKQRQRRPLKEKESKRPHRMQRQPNSRVQTAKRSAATEWHTSGNEACRRRSEDDSQRDIIQCAE